MTNKELIHNSKFLSLVLRHKPSEAGLTLDEHGWALVSLLLKKMNISLTDLEEIVETNNKKRFEFNKDKSRIRARQGHSVDVDVELEEMTPPLVLYHGTQKRFLNSIMEKGIEKMSRKYVHLSLDMETAIQVGKRRGHDYVVVVVNANQMKEDGFKFYLSNNGVWLTDNVPSKYIGVDWEKQ